MILIYTPKYEAHAYTRREYAAMQLIESNPEFLPHIDKIVKRIATHYQLQKKFTPPGHDCNQFVLPVVPPPWRAMASLNFPRI